MSQAGLRKVGWVWTKTGWEACPKRSQTVKDTGTNGASRPQGREGRIPQLISLANQPNEHSDANPT
jgi:hypothetical protein